MGLSRFTQLPVPHDHQNVKEGFCCEGLVASRSSDSPVVQFLKKNPFSNRLISDNWVQSPILRTDFKGAIPKLTSRRMFGAQGGIRTRNALESYSSVARVTAVHTIGRLPQAADRAILPLRTPYSRNRARARHTCPGQGYRKSWQA
jgi:hypothetical protein